jgi:hypothetical protein
MFLFLLNIHTLINISYIYRAVNDKTAKNMLGNAFRRELLMDGQYGQICFIATQSDVFQKSEIKRSLRLVQSRIHAKLSQAPH